MPERALPPDSLVIIVSVRQQEKRPNALKHSGAALSSAPFVAGSVTAQLFGFSSEMREGNKNALCGKGENLLSRVPVLYGCFLVS